MADGVWRTISGRKVFIKKGQSLTEAMKKSGKFKDADIKDDKQSREEKVKKLEKEIAKLEKEVKDLKGIKYIRASNELNDKKKELQELTGEADQRRIDRLEKHDVTLAEERILRQMGVVEDYTLDDLEKAIELSNAISDYTGSKGYKEVRDLSDKSEKTEKLREDLETVIEIGDKYRGETYRGLSFADEGKLNDFMKDVVEGSTLDMKGISSWTNDKSIAKDFASQREYKVIFRNKKNKGGANIGIMSKWRGEGEILYSGKKGFIIKGVTDKNGIIYIDVGEGGLL